MKKLILSLTIASLLTVSLGVGASAQQSQENTPVTVEDVHGNVPAQSDAAQAMTPAVHALVLAMTENNLTYNPEDSQFLWTSLYYMLGMYGEMDMRAELTDETLILPSEVIQDYAAALYPDVTHLPAIPSPISQRISYHAEDDTYHLARGDAGLAGIQFSSCTETSDGTQVLTGDLVFLEDNRSLVQFEATLSETDSMFGYVITNLTLS